VEFSAKGIYKVSIFDLQGRLVLEENTTGNSSFIIPIGTLKKGTYICKVNGESKSFVKL
jgi:hypothetical protein